MLRSPSVVVQRRIGAVLVSCCIKNKVNQVVLGQDLGVIQLLTDLLGSKTANQKVKFTGLTRNSQVDPAENLYKSLRVGPDSGSTL